MFYDNFTDLCSQKGVTPSAVMRAVGLNKSSASYWKKGIIPSGSTLQKLAEYFGVSVDYLLGGSTPPQKALRIVDILSRAPIHPIARINAALEELNNAGQERLATFAEELAEIPRYQAQQAPQAAPAPQEGTDTTPVPEAPRGATEGRRAEGGEERGN